MGSASTNFIRTPSFRSGSLKGAEARRRVFAAMAADAEKLSAQAQRIRDLRALARVSQETAAHSVGVSTRAYREWEAGRSDIAPENLKALAAYFGTTQDFIEYGTMRRVGVAPDPFTDEESQLDRIERALAEMNERLARMEQTLSAGRLAQALREAAQAVRPARTSLDKAAGERDPPETAGEDAP